MKESRSRRDSNNTPHTSRDVTRSAPFLFTVLVTFMFVLGIAIVVPALPLVIEVYDVSRASAGLFLSSFAAGRLAFSLAAGVLGDRWGIRRIALVACAIVLLASIVGAVTSSYPVLLTARTVQGIGSSLYTTVALAYIVGLAPSNQVGKVLATYQGIQLIGISAGPVIGGFVTAVWGIPGPFVLYSIFASVGLLCALRFLPSNGGDASAKKDRISRWAAIRKLASNRSFRLTMIAAFMIFFQKAGISNTLLPLLSVETFAFSQTQIGFLLAVSTLGQISILRVAGSSVDSLGRRATLSIGLWCTVPVLASLTVVQAGWMLFLIACLLGATKGYAGVVPTVVVADLSEASVRGTAIGLQRTITDVGTLLGPVTIGFFIDGWGFAASLWIMAAATLLIAASLIFMRETRPSATPVDSS